VDGKPNLDLQMTDFHRDIERRSLQPLWIDTAQYVPRQPCPRITPALWKYSEMRPLLDRAGDLVRAGEADRRVLVLKNPALPPGAGTTGTLYACLQYLLPGEKAPPHRHMQSAFRFVLAGDGAYTVVNGAKLVMKPGDLILTPAWSWHSHGHAGHEPMVWLDGLDNGIVNLFDASFFEAGAAKDIPAVEDSDRAVLLHPFEKMRSTLRRMQGSATLDPVDGFALRYTNPHTDDHILPTIAAYLQLLPAGFESQACRSTDSLIYVAVEGSGTSFIGDQTISWGPKDIFVVPSWLPRRHQAASEAVLFSFSDRAAQEKLGLWREERHRQRS
jgi:gentisate 1,2-dioxygenase